MVVAGNDCRDVIGKLRRTGRKNETARENPRAVCNR